MMALVGMRLTGPGLPGGLIVLHIYITKIIHYVIWLIMGVCYIPEILN